MSCGTRSQAIRASTNYRECPCPNGPPVTPRNLSGAVQRLSSQPQCFSRRLLCLNRESIEKVTASKNKAGCLKEANHVELAAKVCILCPYWIWWKEGGWRNGFLVNLSEIKGKGSQSPVFFESRCRMRLQWCFSPSPKTAASWDTHWLGWVHEKPRQSKAHQASKHSSIPSSTVLVGCFMYAKTDASDGIIRNTKDSNCYSSIYTVCIVITVSPCLNCT